MADIIQGSPEWHELRIGRVTASRVADVVAKTKSGYSASRANYMAQLIAERLTGTVAESFTNAAMQWGNDQEADARIAYEFYANVDVDQVAFVPHPSIAMTGASPDGLVGDSGLVEIKCPNTATHIETLRGGTVPGKYVTQMFWQMACTGRQWCDFVSYDPRMPEQMRLFIKRIERDDARIRELEMEVIQFLKELSETVQELSRKYGGDVDASEITDQVRYMMAG
ncbi:lambda exonuclease family protein [Falsochrobactrum ovis]|uniref:Putative phage-type endonuclease n=1 Tax=Falsochrobactrum ovis TaxID=1293442 RepID=A0A364JVG9_9HYPH|nr:lambda exonuclease family protein [Falsochrobactrum ovis]RAK29115.1 putative phage-type endonuclease [Falsochrobactrum ovis]